MYAWTYLLYPFQIAYTSHFRLLRQGLCTSITPSTSWPRSPNRPDPGSRRAGNTGHLQIRRCIPNITKVSSANSRLDYASRVRPRRHREENLIRSRKAKVKGKNTHQTPETSLMPLSAQRLEHRVRDGFAALFAARRGPIRVAGYAPGVTIFFDKGRARVEWLFR